MSRPTGRRSCVKVNPELRSKARASRRKCRELLHAPPELEDLSLEVRCRPVRHVHADDDRGCLAEPAPGRRARDAKVRGDGHVPGGIHEIPKPVIIALLTAARGRHAADHRSSTDATQPRRTLQAAADVASDDNSRRRVQNVGVDSSALRHDVARNTIKVILKDHGIEPAPQRGANMPWKTFLAAHWDGLAAADFFTVEVLTLRGLVRYVVLFVMKLKTRTVKIAGMTAQPDETWMRQIARNVTAAGDGFLRGMSHIILDRDPLYTAAFRRLLRDSGVTPVVLPAWSPNLNAFAERFVGSAKSECLDRMVLLGESHLQAAVREFVRHYHEERPHQGLKNELIAPTTVVSGTGHVKCRERLGGLLKFYYREAA